MTNRSFDDFVDRQTAEAEEPQVDLAARLEEWQRHLTDFYGTVEGHLSKYVKETKVSLDYAEKEIHEDQLGTYRVKVLTVSIGRSYIRFDPIGTILVAAKGRVDMIGPNGTVTFVLVPADSTGPKIKVTIRTEGEEAPETPPSAQPTEWAWRIATQPPRIRYIPIEEESLFEAIMEVSDA